MAADNTTNCLTTLHRKVIADKIASGELVLRDNRNFSRCWDVFAKIEDLNGVEIESYVQCRICKKLFYYRSHATSNLVRHRCYIDKYKTVGRPSTTKLARYRCKYKAQKWTSIKDVETRKNENSKASVDIKVIENPSNQCNLSSESPTIELETMKPSNSNTNFEIKVIEDPRNDLLQFLTMWLIKDCRSYGLLQDSGLKAVFQKLVLIGSKLGNNLDVDTLLPSTRAVARNVNEIYEQCFETVKADIALIEDNGFGLVVDACKDYISGNSYIALTIHFLKNGTVRSRLLGLRGINREEYTSQNIHETVETILNDFDCKLSSKSIIVTKGGDSFIEAFEKYEHVSCISHLLNTALRKSLQQVSEVTELARAAENLVNFLKNSPLNFSFSSPWQSFCPSRWNTLYNMLISLENNWNEITNVLKEQNEQQRIESINLIHLKAVIKTLQPFKEAIEELEEENSSTLHLVLVYLHELRKSCATNDSEFKDFDFIESLKEKIGFYLDDIATGNSTTLYKIALFLYPPTNKLLQFSDTEKQFIEEECIRLMKSYESELKPIIKQEYPATTSPVCKRKKFFSDFVELETNCDPNELIKRELQCYKYLRVINSDDFDVFSWWEQQRNNFPLLYQLSCAVLATPASTSSAQRIFSAAASLLCENTSDVGHLETNVEQIMFINANSEQDDLESEFELK